MRPRSRNLIDQAKAQNPEVDKAAAAAVKTGFDRIEELDVEIKEQSSAMVKAAVSLGSGEAEDFGTGGSIFTHTAKDGFVNAARTKTSYGTIMRMKAATLGGALLPLSGTTVSLGTVALTV